MEFNYLYVRLLEDNTSHVASVEMSEIMYCCVCIKFDYVFLKCEECTEFSWEPLSIT